MARPLSEGCDVCGRDAVIEQEFGEISTLLCDSCARDPRIGEPELMAELDAFGCSGVQHG